MFKFKLYCDKTYRKNYWYIWCDGSCIAGPFDNKGEAVSWIKKEG